MSLYTTLFVDKLEGKRLDSGPSEELVEGGGSCRVGNSNDSGVAEPLVHATELI